MLACRSRFHITRPVDEDTFEPASHVVAGVAAVRGSSASCTPHRPLHWGASAKRRTRFAKALKTSAVATPSRAHPAPKIIKGTPDACAVEIPGSFHDFVHHIKVPFAINNKTIGEYFVSVTWPAVVNQRLLPVNPRLIRFAMGIKVAHENNLAPLLIKANDELAEQRCLFDLLSTRSWPKMANNNIQTGGTAV